jgi:hypothetical protein
MIVDYCLGKLLDRQVLCTREIGAAQDCAGEKGALKVRIAENCVAGVCASQVRAAKGCAAEISATDKGSMNVKRPARGIDVIVLHHDPPSLFRSTFMISWTSIGGSSSP